MSSNKNLEDNFIVDYYEILEQSKIGIWNINLIDKKCILKGQRFIKSILGINKPIVKIDMYNALDLCHPRDHEMIKSRMYESLKDNKEYNINYRIWNGRDWRWIFSYGKPVISNGKVIGLKGFIQDTHEKMIFQEILAETAEADKRTKLMLDSTPLSCSFWDENFNNIDCNQEALNLFGVSTKQEYLDRFSEFAPEYQPDGNKSEEMTKFYLKEAFEKGRMSFNWTHRKITGELIPAEITLVRVEKDNKPIVIGYARDLTELRKTEVKLEEERSLLRNILDSSPICFLILVDGIVRFASKFTRDFLGINEGKDIRKFYGTQSEYAELAEDLILGSTPSVNWRPFNLKIANGQIRNFLINLIHTEFEGDMGLIIWLMDVTDMKKTEMELSITKEAAERNARAKSEFLANMSHEVRTPMNAILGMTHLALKTDLTKQQKEYLLKIEQSTKLLLRIINDILDFSKIESGKLDMENISFFIEDVITDIVNIVENDIGRKNLKLDVNIDKSIDKELIGDPLRVNQILLNIVNNAIKFTDKGKITIDVTKKFGEKNNVVLLFKVIDTGIGMKDDKVNLIFSPFSQADSSVTRKYGGTGLGLAICKQLVNLMHGDIWCESKLDIGTTFCFTVKLGILNNNIDTNEDKNNNLILTNNDIENEQIIIPDNIKGASILLVEDNEINQILAKELLSIEGFRVDIASNGIECIRALQSDKKYDLVLMDIQMPVLDGLNATREIRKMGLFDDLPIIAMTANAMSGDREEGMEAGMDDYITKPIEPNILYKTIIKWIKKD